MINLKFNLKTSQLYKSEKISLYMEMATVIYVNSLLGLFRSDTTQKKHPLTSYLLMMVSFPCLREASCNFH